MRPARIALFISLFFLSCPGFLLGSEKNGIGEPVDTTISIKSEDPISLMLDSLIRLNFFEKTPLIVNSSGKKKFPQDSIPVYDDLVYEARLAKLNANSPFNLDYNSAVKSYIDMYANRKREVVSRMLGLARLYFPLFEETLDKYNLPLELKYLAIVESALNANAKSRSGAMGLWQFMYPTGKMYKLNVTSYVDERCDPYKSTIAACEYFKDLYAMFGDWQLVLAAYNGGPGTLNKAIRRSGGKRNYWELRPFLPVETRGYVPAFIAVNYVMNYTEEHNLFPVELKNTFLHVDTIHIKDQIRFDQISAVLNIPVEEIDFLNPAYKKNIIPYNENCYSLCLPADKIGSFINNETAIINYLRSPDRILELTEPVYVSKEHVKYHTVRKGEHLSSISKKYNCTVDDLKVWNNLKKVSLNKGQKLKIIHTEQVPKTDNSFIVKTEPSKDKQDSLVAKTDNIDPGNISIENLDNTKAEENGTIIPAREKKSVKSNEDYIYHVVQPGDTLWGIANRYNGVTVEKLKSLNRINNAKGLKPGTKIKVGVSG